MSHLIRSYLMAENSKGTYIGYIRKQKKLIRQLWYATTIFCGLLGRLQRKNLIFHMFMVNSPTPTLETITIFMNYAADALVENCRKPTFPMQLPVVDTLRLFLKTITVAKIDQRKMNFPTFALLPDFMTQQVQTISHSTVHLLIGFMRHYDYKIKDKSERWETKDEMRNRRLL